MMRLNSITFASSLRIMKPVHIQRNLAILSVVLFLGKMLAWYITHSVTVLTDALEGIVNMAAGFLGLYSIILSARPRDANHPYGHGKAEFLSSAVEGTLILVAGVVVVYEAIHHLIEPAELEKLDIGLVILAVAGTINYLAGRYAEKKGEQHSSLILVSAGKHLQTDAYSAVAILLGLTLIYFTQNKWPWLDSVVALCFAVIIILTGYRVLRKSISGIMDEMDLELLKRVIDLLQEKRRPQWVDLHNLRVIEQGNMLHVDAHMTLPWYHKVADADKEIHELEQMIKARFENHVELFVHIDGCKPYQCHLCSLENCPVRKEAFKGQLEWNMNNVWADSKHGKVTPDTVAQ
ncbi:MAG: cation diffusion facilitator family transporter [Flavipsychrobacter sp.]|jgi:cation diffusion facilitator family transporter|nr:cation diffusion facilitator family transporter [Flavipsychrobacter sp.]